MGNDLNKWIGIGRLTKDAALTYSSSGTAVCKFDIAVNKTKKHGEQNVEEVSFVPIILWGKAAESLNQYLVKGKQVAVDGELHQNRWEQDGQARSKVEIIAHDVQLLGGGQGSTQSNDNGRKYQERPKNATAAPSGRDTGDSEPPDFQDDIPF